MPFQTLSFTHWRLIALLFDDLLCLTSRLSENVCGASFPFVEFGDGKSVFGLRKDQIQKQESAKAGRSKNAQEETILSKPNTMFRPTNSNQMLSELINSREMVYFPGIF